MADQKILDRVAALLAIAEHPNTGEHEADTALRQANRLIAKHSIEEAVLRASQTASQRRALIRHHIVVGRNEFSPYLQTVLFAAVEANRCSATYRNGGFEVFGTDEDVRWVETIYSMIHLQFLSKINPKWDAAKTLDENIYNFKVAGYKWAEINQKAMQHGHPSMESTKAATNHWTGDSYLVGTGFYHKMFGAYKRYAKLIGDVTPVATQNQQAFRLSYAESFRSTMCDRFYQMGVEAEEEMDTIPGSALVMVSQKEEADRMMWDAFPSMDPVNVAKAREEMVKDAQERAASHQAWLDAMTPAERNAYLEKEEKLQRKLAKQDRAYWKKNTYYVDASARAKGAQAANSVNLSRNSGSTGGSTAKGALE